MNFWSSDFRVTGELEGLQHVAASLQSTARPVIFDVGANVGDYALCCRELMPDDAEVHAFEPSARTFALLKTKLQGSNIHLHNLGFSDSSRDTTLFSSEPGSTIASVHALERPIRPFRDEFAETVSLTTIDSFCAEQGIQRIDFLKLDIEGHEVAALEGASGMIGQGRIRFIQFEFGENNVSSRTYLGDFVRLLAGRYKIYRVVPGGLVSWTYEGGRSEIFATMNYLCELNENQRQ
jgi:FkbM family methyltransferase